MKIITTERPVFVDEGYHYSPFVRYIVSDYEALVLLDSCRDTKIEVSSFNSYERRYAGQSLSGKRVCIYRHMAFGDQLMVSCVPRYIKTLYPDATVHLYCHPSFRHLWDTNPFVGGAAIPIPIPFDVARAYNYHIFYEGMLENDAEPDQGCCYDNFFECIGLKDVPPQFKRPHIRVRPEDYRWVVANSINLRGKYLVYHLSPANKNRCYPPEQGAMFIKMFLDAYPAWCAYVVGQDSGGLAEPISRLGPMGGRLFNLIGKTGNFRDLIPIVERASLVVAPDSSVLHLAGAFPDVPAISMWGIFHPDDRIKYYSNHYALMSRVCPHFPCHNHDFQLPREKCRSASNWREGHQYCCALSAIQPEHILARARSLVK